MACFQINKENYISRVDLWQGNLWIVFKPKKYNPKIHIFMRRARLKLTLMTKIKLINHCRF